VELELIFARLLKIGQCSTRSYDENFMPDCVLLYWPRESSSCPALVIESLQCV